MRTNAGAADWTAVFRRSQKRPLIPRRCFLKSLAIRIRIKIFNICIDPIRQVTQDFNGLWLV